RIRAGQEQKASILRLCRAIAIRMTTGDQQILVITAAAAAEACVAIGLTSALLICVLPRKYRRLVLLFLVMALLACIVAFTLTFKSASLLVAADWIGTLLEALPALYISGRILWDPLVTLDLVAIFVVQVRRGASTWKSWAMYSGLWLIWAYIPLL